MRIHVVQKGDTLWKISKIWVDFEELKSVNSQLSNPDMIMPGMKIKVPQGKKQVKKEAQKKEAPKKEMPKKEAPKKEAPKKEAPKKEMPKPKPTPKPKPMPKIQEDEKEADEYANDGKANDAHSNEYADTNAYGAYAELLHYIPSASNAYAQKPKPKAAKPKPMKSHDIKPKEMKPKEMKPKEAKPNEPMNHPKQENVEYYQPQHQQKVQELPYGPPMPYPTPWDYFWCPPYMGMSHQPMMNQPMMNQPMNQPMMNQPMNQPMMNQPMNQPMMNQPMNHPMANPHHPMPFMHGMEGDDSENHPFMMGEGQKQGGCGCSGKKSMPMGYENQPPNQMMDPNMNNWFPMMNDNEQMRGYFPQPGQPPQPLYNWEAEQPWQDDEDED